MTYNPVCHSDEQTFQEGNEGFSQRFAQCLMVLPRYSSESVFKTLAPEVLLLQASGELSYQPGVYTVMSRHAISTGSFVDVMVFVTTPINADGAAVTDTLPKGVPARACGLGPAAQRCGQEQRVLAVRPPVGSTNPAGACRHRAPRAGADPAPPPCFILNFPH